MLSDRAGFGKTAEVENLQKASDMLVFNHSSIMKRDTDYFNIVILDALPALYPTRQR